MPRRIREKRMNKEPSPVHYTNVEYDTQTRSMNKHKQQVPNNDSQARNKFYKINGK